MLRFTQAVPESKIFLGLALRINLIFINKVILLILVLAGLLIVTKVAAEDGTYVPLERSQNPLYEVYLQQPLYSTSISKSQGTTLAVVLNTRTDYCSCVSYSRSISPKPIKAPTNARDIKPNSWVPGLMDWVIFTPGYEYSYWGHVGVILAINYSDRTMRVVEANYETCRRGERWISIDDPNIRGYYK